MYVGETFNAIFPVYEQLRNHWISVDRESNARLREVENRIYASFPTLDSDSADVDSEDPLGYNLARVFVFRHYSDFWRTYARR